MTLTWSSDAEGDVTCATCGAVYSVHPHPVAFVDSACFACAVCGERLREWNTQCVPEFKFVAMSSANEPAATVGSFQHFWGFRNQAAAESGNEFQRARFQDSGGH